MSDDQKRKKVTGFHLLTTKPTMYIANVARRWLFEDNPYLDQVREIAEAEGQWWFPICTAEAEIPS